MSIRSYSTNGRESSRFSSVSFWRQPPSSSRSNIISFNLSRLDRNCSNNVDWGDFYLVIRVSCLPPPRDVKIRVRSHSLKRMERNMFLEST